MSRTHDFSLGEAIEIAKRNDPGPDVPSVSRTLLAHIDTLTARAAELEHQRDDYLSREWVATKARQRAEADYHRVMGLLRDMQMEHGTCRPRERRACTNCNASDDLASIVAAYRGAPIRLTKDAG